MFCFIACQVSILNKEENKRDTIVDRVFRKALQEFHMQLISSYSVLMKVRPLSESIKVSVPFTVHCAFVLLSVVRSGWYISYFTCLLQGDSGQSVQVVACKSNGKQRV